MQRSLGGRDVGTVGRVDRSRVRWRGATVGICLPVGRVVLGKVQWCGYCVGYRGDAVGRVPRGGV